jgi:putative ABC transport system ATP-binding protein
MTRAIEGSGLYKFFKNGRHKLEVLKRVDFDADAGDVTMVMGPSGSGKSTLIAALSGLLRPDEGKVVRARPGSLVHGERPHRPLPPRQLRLHLPGLQPVLRPDRRSSRSPPVLKYQGLSPKAARDRAPRR